MMFFRASAMMVGPSRLTQPSLAGFDGSLMGGINAMPQYSNFFGYKEVGASTGIGEHSPYSARARSHSSLCTPFITHSVPHLCRR